ncbi:Selenoprotein U [Aphelenchoides bicaudatus]|nr:Selenoprotein U [Aphelenchoides bicaudatus]
MLFYAIGAALAGTAIYANLPTKYTLGHIVPTVTYLAKGRLLPINKEGQAVETGEITAGDLFEKSPVLLAVIRRPGCMFCRREAKYLSDMKDKLDAKNVKLIGVVHETKGVKEFQPYLSGDVFFDPERHFYGPNQRWLPLWMGFMRLSTYTNMMKTKQEKFEGNTEGEGRLLGGVYLIKGNEMVFSHLEREWGDAVDPKQVEEALNKL